MHSLYWRIFLAFWLALALILIGTVTVAVNAALQHRTERPWAQRAQLYMQAMRAFETDGPDGLKAWLKGLGTGDPVNRTFVFDSSGRDLLGRPVPDFLRDEPEGRSAAEPSGRSAAEAAGRSTTALAGLGTNNPPAMVGRGALVLTGPNGLTYYVVVGPKDGPRLFGGLELPGVPISALIIAVVVSGAICFFLARYLVAPIDRLRYATRQMAAGDLNVRVSEALRGRQTDLGLLAADLDTMAERVRNLLETKQQLLRDVSHELRSPLARLQLAVSLARRQESGVERHLERIAREADRLEQLIARTLKLARLERPAHTLGQGPVEIGQLLKSIISDVAIEADAQGCTVGLQADPALVVSGDAELLRSTFENVIRNAVRYSPPGEHVDITARLSAGTSSVEVVVRDQGPGVPEKDLQLIFEPFYRVDAARDRAGGGEGLGLAIAARAVALHGGTIEASNVPAGGLAVSITLPAQQARANQVEERSSAAAA